MVLNPLNDGKKSIVKSIFLTARTPRKAFFDLEGSVYEECPLAVKMLTFKYFKLYKTIRSFEIQSMLVISNSHGIDEKVRHSECSG